MVVAVVAVVSMVVVAITFIVNGMVAPIRMQPFPVREPRQAEGFTLSLIHI